MSEKINNTIHFKHKEYSVILKPIKNDIIISFKGEFHIPNIYTIESIKEAKSLAKKIINMYSWIFIATINGYKVYVKQIVGLETLYTYQAIKRKTIISEKFSFETFTAAMNQGISAARNS